MKKFVRDQLLEIIDTIFDAVRRLKKKDSNTADILIADCSDAFFAIGNALALELSNERYPEYEKLINGIFEQMGSIMSSREQNKSFSEPLTRLKSLISTLQTELINEAEVKREIVFLPYNASMWDSMESIWKAASNDPECECFVIPIPYYERMPDLSLGTRHYEFDKFPEYVPVLDYNEYDFELHRPDVIYIHNPYDDGNFVTSVEPSFYSRNLINYTDMLVYVPYFISSSAMPESYAQQAGLQNAHRIIVQSEELAKIYRKFHNPNKIIALGSPKTDKIIEICKNPPEPPEEWKKIIRGRKAVMYNTTVTSFLQYNEKFLEKIRHMISLFEQRQDDLVLIWRPHPLSEGSTKSMRPQLLRDYYALVDEYRSKNIGIYDDTPSFHTALAISDAYIGGNSSLDYLFGVTGKPVMRQNININRSLTDDELGILWFGDMAVDGDEAWFSAQNHNGLYKMNLTTGETEFITHIPFCRENGCYQFAAIEKLGSKLFFAPYSAECILEYDIATGEFTRVELEFTGLPYCYISIVRHENKLFFIPYANDEIIEYNAETGQYIHHTKWYNQIKDMLIGTNGTVFGRGSVVIDDYIYLPFLHSNCVLRFDTRNGNVKLIRVGSAENKYLAISSDGDDIWLTDLVQAKVVRYNPATNRSDVYNDFNSFGELPDNPFFLLASTKNDILVFPNRADTIFRINKDSGKASKFSDIPAVNNAELCYFPYGSPNCRCVKDCGGFVYVLQTYAGPLYKLDKSSGEVTQIDIKYSKTQALDFSSLPIAKTVPDTPSSYHEYLFAEHLVLNGAEHFLDCIASSKPGANQNQVNAFGALFANPDGTVGERIHAYIMDQLK